MARRRTALGRRNSDPLAAFLRYLEEIDDAVLRHDALGITSLLRKRIATHLPRDVRDELLAQSRMARHSLRAPVQFFRFHHRMLQLALGGDRLPTAQTELQFDPPAPAGSVRRIDEHRAAACDPRNDSRDEPHGNPSE